MNAAPHVGSTFMWLRSMALLEYQTFGEKKKKKRILLVYQLVSPCYDTIFFGFTESDLLRHFRGSDHHAAAILVRSNKRSCHCCSSCARHAWNCSPWDLKREWSGNAAWSFGKHCKRGMCHYMWSNLVKCLFSATFWQLKWLDWKGSLILL